MKILLTGATGRLGTELRKLRTYDYTPSHRAGEWDITDQDSIDAYLLDKEVDLIVHTAAYTFVEQAEINRLLCYKTNVVGSENIYSMRIPTLGISTEYAVNPTNYYAKTKEESEFEGSYDVRTLRLSFKPRPFPYPGAFTDQWTTGDYIDVIAKEVDRAIDLFNLLPRITNIGTARKTVYELAKQTRPDVQPMSRLEIKGANLPEDTSMDCSKWEQIKQEHP